MPTNTFNIGRDATLVLIAPNGTRIDLPLATSFDAKQNVHDLHVSPLNGPPQFAKIPGGWDGTFEVERGSSTVDDVFSAMESAFWAVGSIGVGQIFQYINEVGGSTSTYQFDGVALHLSNAGSYKADGTIKQTITFTASTRKKL